MKVGRREEACLPCSMLCPWTQSLFRPASQLLCWEITFSSSFPGPPTTLLAPGERGRLLQGPSASPSAQQPQLLYLPLGTTPNIPVGCQEESRNHGPWEVVLEVRDNISQIPVGMKSKLTCPPDLNPSGNGGVMSQKPDPTALLCNIA